MPDYDYEQFDRRQEEWEKAQELAKAEEAQASIESSDTTPTEDTSGDVIESDEDMDW